MGVADIVEANTGTGWAWWQCVLLRFAVLFWGYVCLFNPIVLSQMTSLGAWVDRWILPWTVLALLRPPEMLEGWFAVNVFHLTGVAANRHPTSSGDTARDWVGMLALIVFAAVGAAMWSALAEWGIARRGWRRDYRALYAWLLLAVRFTLVSILLAYGISKVFDLQFSRPDVRVLNERFGDSSPMELMWTFVGYSVPYTIFSGLMEVIPGVLLLFRRTAILGALMAAAVMLNVALLNFCYDVPVELYSSLDVLMALFLLLPDVPALFRFFVRRRDARLQGVWVKRPERSALRLAGYCVWALLIGHLVYMQVGSDAKQWRERRAQGAEATAGYRLMTRGFHRVQEYPYSR
jgi:uncharacterized membrane protein YphA (DoxX/SURF4 family)